MPRTLNRRPKPAEEYEKEEEQPARRSFRGRDSDDAPKGRKSATSGKSRGDDSDEGIVSSGWGGYKRMKDEAPSKWEQTYKPPEDGEEIIKFLEDGPYANVLEHWVDEMPKGKPKSYTCLGSHNDCPLCDIGDVPTAYVKFNIAVIPEDGEPVVRVYKTGITMTEAIKKYADSRQGPLTNPDLYFATTTNVSGKGKSATKRQAVRPVKARDLEDDFEIPPLDDDELDKLEKRCWTVDSIKNNSREELTAVVRYLERGEEDDDEEEPRSRRRR